MVQDMDLVRTWARRYRDMGLSPLPSCGHLKRPSLSSRWILKFREKQIPQSWIARWWAPNIQIPLGVRWGLCVVDIDGPDGVRIWNEIGRDHLPTSLRSWSSGAVPWASGFHLWFRLPSGLESFSTVTLWQGDGKHQEIKILGDRSLVVVPPSIHPERQTRYEWLVGPDQLRSPAMIPGWLLERCEQSRAKVAPAKPRPAFSGLPLGRLVGRHYQRDEVLYALGDRKHDIAAAYGLEVHKHPSSSGFHACRSIDRDDNRWSCTIDPRTGVYTDWATGEKLPFFTVLMRLDPGTFPNYTTTVDLMGSYCFGGEPCPQSTKVKSKSKT